MSSSQLTKRLYGDITKLKLLDTDSSDPRFRLKTSPFPDDDSMEQSAAAKTNEYVITGQIFPKSDIYRERSYLIEMKLPKTFPLDPPVVRFLTSIYHPNVDKDGTFCNELLQKTATWTATTSLVQVVKTVVEHIDKPDIDRSLRAEVGKEYVENPEQFKRIALENVKQHGLPRQ